MEGQKGDGIHVTREEQEQAWDPEVGAGTPGDAPYENIEVPWLRRQPLIALVLAIVLVDLAALVTELTAGTTSTATAVLLGTLATLATVGGRIAWAHVTPVADPKVNREDRL